MRIVSQRKTLPGSSYPASWPNLLGQKITTVVVVVAWLSCPDQITIIIAAIILIIAVAAIIIITALLGNLQFHRFLGKKHHRAVRPSGKDYVRSWSYTTNRIPLEQFYFLFSTPVYAFHFHIYYSLTLLAKILVLRLPLNWYCRMQSMHTFFQSITNTISAISDDDHCFTFTSSVCVGTLKRTT